VTMKWIVDYIRDNFSNDEKTGFIWKCVEHGLRTCHPE